MKKWLIYLVGIGTVGLFIFTSDLQLFSSSKKSKESGKIVSVEGTVMGRSPQDPFFLDLKTQSPIFSGQKILTGFNSQTLIDFGEEFLLMANTSVRLVKEGDLYHVYLLAGEIRRQNPGTSAEFWVDSNVVKGSVIRTGQKAAIADFPNLGDLPADKVAGEQPNTKIQALLQDNFRLHQRFMEKCFIKHYERKEGQTQSGVVWMEFNLEKNGNFSSIHVKKSDFQDPQFHQCIAEVVSRVQLKYYEGEFMKIDFPIQVTLPH